MVFLVVCAITVSATCATVSAQTYSTEYPSIGNSGSPLWLHCQIENLGDFCIIFDPSTNPQSFGFDTPTVGYNLINNTSKEIVGRAYATDGTKQAYSAKFPSFYRIQLRTGYNSVGQQTVYEDYKIIKIYGTTLDLIDYTGDRGSDTLTREEERDGYEAAQTVILVVIGLCLLMRGWFKFTYRQRGERSGSMEH